MSKKLWEASEAKKKNSNLYKYETFLSKKYKNKFNQNYSKILDWTINNPYKFWSSIWDYCKIKGRKGNKKLIKSIISTKNLIMVKLYS